MSTNEIAKKSGLSVGTIYSYFGNKKEIIFCLIDEYNKSFDKIFDELSSYKEIELFKNDTKLWIVNLINLLIKNEDSQIHFQIESLSYSIPEVRKILNDQKIKMQNLTRECLVNYSDKKVDDKTIKTLSVILFDFVTSLVDEIKYGNNSLADNESIKDHGANYIYLIITNYLIVKK